MSLRTDLAVESVYNHVGSGIEETNEKIGTINLTKIDITTQEAAKKIGKPIGTYITLESPYIGVNSPEHSQEISIQLSNNLKELIKNAVPNFSHNTKVLVCGLGNRNITPDSLGTECAKSIMVTNHIIELLNKNEKDFSCVSVITPGVMGITGIETNEIIKGVTNEFKPNLIITIDALCAMTKKRMFKTIQITDTGISPGAGVGNKRREISEKTMNVPVISLGIPTVVDSNSIIYDFLTSVSKENEKSQIYINKILAEEDSLFVSPKDIDELIKRSSKTISDAINLSLHNNIDFDFIESYTC